MPVAEVLRRSQTRRAQNIPTNPLLPISLHLEAGLSRPIRTVSTLVPVDHFLHLVLPRSKSLLLRRIGVLNQIPNTTQIITPMLRLRDGLRLNKIKAQSAE